MFTCALRFLQSVAAGSTFGQLYRPGVLPATCPARGYKSAFLVACPGHVYRLAALSTCTAICLGAKQPRLPENSAVTASHAGETAWIQIPSSTATATAVRV